MLHQSDPEADEADGEPVPFEYEAKMPANETYEENGLGRSEDDAIALSDDEAEDSNDRQRLKRVCSDDPIEATKQVASGDGFAAANRSVASAPAVLSADPNDFLSDCRLYRIIFGDSQLGLEVALHEGRIVVARITADRIARLGDDSKPGVGDILAAIGGHSLGLIPNLKATLNYLKSVLQKPPVELMFIESPIFIEAFRKKDVQKTRDDAQEPPPHAAPSENRPAAPSASDDFVIDLLLDDC